MPLDGYNGLTQLQAAYQATDGASVPTTIRPAGDSTFAGILWVTSAMAMFAGLAIFARAAMNAGVPPFEVVFLRNLLATLALLPLLLTRGWELLRPPSLGLYGLRCSLSALTMFCWFYALSIIPVGEVMAIGFLGPLFGTLAAILILGEVVRARRWTALAIGFLGAMIILRPAGSGFGVGQLCALASAMLGGILAILVKQLTNRDDPNRIVFLSNAILTPISLVPALFVWIWPPLAVWPLLLGMGCCAVLGHIALTRAFAAMPASLVLTFEFSRLPFSVGLAYLVFGETIDRWTWLGAAIIFASAVYVTRREAQLAQAKRVADQIR